MNNESNTPSKHQTKWCFSNVVRVSSISFFSRRSMCFTRRIGPPWRKLASCARAHCIRARSDLPEVSPFVFHQNPEICWFLWGPLHRWATPIVGWFLWTGKSHLEMGWWLGVPPWLGKPPLVLHVQPFVSCLKTTTEPFPNHFDQFSVHFPSISQHAIKNHRYYANWCQLVLAVVEIIVTKIKVGITSPAGGFGGFTIETRLQLWNFLGKNVTSFSHDWFRKSTRHVSVWWFPYFLHFFFDQQMAYMTGMIRGWTEWLKPPISFDTFRCWWSFEHRKMMVNNRPCIHYHLISSTPVLVAFNFLFHPTSSNIQHSQPENSHCM